MSNIQIVLYLLALLSIYAVAAELDERAAVPVDRPLGQSVVARRMPAACRRAASPEDAASAPLAC